MSLKYELKRCVESGDLETLNQLLPSAKRYDYVYDNGSNLFHLFIENSYGRFCMMHTLVRHCPDLLNRPTKDGDTPLHLAVVYGDYMSFDCLLRNGADPSIPNRKNETVYDYVNKYRRTGNFFKTLSKYQDSDDDEPPAKKARIFQSPKVQCVDDEPVVESVSGSESDFGTESTASTLPNAHISEELEAEPVQEQEDAFLEKIRQKWPCADKKSCGCLTRPPITEICEYFSKPVYFCPNHQGQYCI